MTNNHLELIEQARLLVQRLERISADSIWARRASGHRGALLRWIEGYDLADGKIEMRADETARIESLVKSGFQFLERAAQERLR
jgi:hypothetical protein